MPVIHRLAVLLGRGSLAFNTAAGSRPDGADPGEFKIRPVVAAAGSRPCRCYINSCSPRSPVRVASSTWPVPAYLDLHGGRRTRASRAGPPKWRSMRGRCRRRPRRPNLGAAGSRFAGREADPRGSDVTGGGVSVDAIQVHLAGLVLAESGDSLDNLLGLERGARANAGTRRPSGRSSNG